MRNSICGWALAIVLSVLSGGDARARQTIPFRLEDSLVHVIARVNGRPVSAVLDSGSGSLLLDRLATERLGIVAGHSASSALGGGAHEQQLFPLVIGDTKLGSINLKSVSGFSIDLQSLSTSAGFAIEALLGGPIFADRIVEIDYPKRSITFYRTRQAPLCVDPIPLTIRNGVPIADVTLRAQRSDAAAVLHLIVDLGSRRFAAVIGGAFLRTKSGMVLAQSGTPQQIGTGTGGAVAGTTVRIAELNVGNHSYQNLGIALTAQVRTFEAVIADGTLGVPLWNRGTITFDYADKQLCLE